MENFIEIEDLKKNIKSSSDPHRAEALKEIEKMDALIMIKLAQKKEVESSRIEMEKESLEVLHNLAGPDISKTNKINLKRCLKLIGNDKTINSGEANQNKMTEEEAKQENFFKISQICANLEKTNIQIAKCENVVGSYADGYKKIIANDLVGAEEFRPEDAIVNRPEFGPFLSEYWKSEMKDDEKNDLAFVDSERWRLSEIDEQLEALKKSLTNDSMNEPRAARERECENAESRESEFTNESSEKEMKRKNVEPEIRLKEIDKSLSNLNSESHEEIEPLSHQEIKLLIRNVKKNLVESEVGIGGRAFCAMENTSRKLQPTNIFEVTSHSYSKAVLTQLVSNAKHLMPKFKYRYDET